MCLTADAFAMFLSVMATYVDISAEPGRYILHAQVHDAHWVAVEDRWCTMAPQLDRMDRFAQVAK